MMRIACGMTTRRSVWPGDSPMAPCRLLLALGDSLDTGANDLGDKGARVDDERQRSERSARAG